MRCVFLWTNARKAEGKTGVLADTMSRCVLRSPLSAFVSRYRVLCVFSWKVHRMCLRAVSSFQCSQVQCLQTQEWGDSAREKHNNVHCGYFSLSITSTLWSSPSSDRLRQQPAEVLQLSSTISFDSQMTPDRPVKCNSRLHLNHKDTDEHFHYFY